MDDVIAALQEVVPVVREEPGCLAYVPHIVKGKRNKNTIVFYEKYEDQAILDAHSAKLPTYFKNVFPHIQGNIDIKVCEEIV